MNTFQDYKERDKILLGLGYSSYKNYLHSPLWKKIRTKVIQRANGLCEISGCNAAASQVHHLVYSQQILLGYKRKLRHLIAVCRSCHTHGEFANRQKVSRSEANHRLGFGGWVPCPKCHKQRVRTDFENFSGTQQYKICRCCRK